MKKEINHKTYTNYLFQIEAFSKISTKSSKKKKKKFVKASQHFLLNQISLKHNRILQKQTNRPKRRREFFHLMLGYNNVIVTLRTINDERTLEKVPQEAVSLKTQTQSSTAVNLTFCVFGLIQRTKKGLEELSVAIKECRES